MWGSNPSSNVQAQKSVISEIMLDVFQLAVCYHTHSNYFFYCFSIITCSQKNMKCMFLLSYPISVLFQWQMNSLPQNCFASLFFTEQCSSCRNFAKKTIKNQNSNYRRTCECQVQSFSNRIPHNDLSTSFINNERFAEHLIVSEDCVSHFNSLNSKQ